MPTVLVTGARGLLGSSLVPYLKTAGNRVICVSRKPGTDVCADLTNRSEALRCVSSIKPDTIINLALTDVDACERDKNSAYIANVSIVENIVASLRAAALSSHLLQISTDQLYDGQGPHTEPDITLTNAYAESKYKGEIAAAAAPSTILRTNFFGPSQRAGRASFSDWILASLRSLTPITVFDDILFSPLSISSLVALIAIVASRPQTGIFNLGSMHGMSKADFAFALANVFDVPTGTMKRGFSSSRSQYAYRPKDMRMDSTLFERTFSVKLPTLMREIESMREDDAHASR
jgi:dTDP-4-dehydrorhamnose reductase